MVSLKAFAQSSTPAVETGAVSEETRRFVGTPATVTGMGTINTLPKWTSTSGALADSVVSEVGGKVGIGTTSPGATLHVYGAADRDVFAGFGPDPGAGPSMNFGYAGISIGRGAGFFNVRPDAGSTAPNPSLRFDTVNIERMMITNAGLVGIGAFVTPSQLPRGRLDVLEPTQLGSSVGSSALVTTFEALTSNRVAENLWFVRSAAGSDYNTVRLRNGISNDGSFFTPDTTRTWWERDPGADTQSWGTAAATYMQLTPAGLNITGNLTVTGNITSVNGDITGVHVLNAVYMDVAEWVASESPVVPGTVVVLDPKDGRRVVASSRAYDTSVAGVVPEK